MRKPCCIRDLFTGLLVNMSYCRDITDFFLLSKHGKIYLQGEILHELLGQFFPLGFNLILNADFLLTWCINMGNIYKFPCNREINT